MTKTLYMLALAGYATALAIRSDTPITVSSSPSGASDPIPEAFVSFSIEFAFFPEYAGNSHPPVTYGFT